MSHSLWLCELEPARLFCPWDSPGKNTGVGGRALLQAIFQTQGSNPHLLHCSWIFYHWATWGALWCHIIVKKSESCGITDSWTFCIEHMNLSFLASDFCLSFQIRAIFTTQFGWHIRVRQCLRRIFFFKKMSFFKDCWAHSPPSGK